VYDQEWYIGCVSEKGEDLKQAQLLFLEPKDPSSSFYYPTKADILIVPPTDVTTSNRRSFILGKAEQYK
jgi:hypothetical protein